MAVTASRAFLTPRVTDLSPKAFHHLLLLRSYAPRRLSSTTTTNSVAVRCLISGVDGGGVSDEFVSTRNSGFWREFSVVANMLKRIEPLDNSVISKGVSESAKDSMKQTISTMLGLLPSDQFSVAVRVSRRPLERLIVSSIITGYTLWNAEYRISLMRNLDISLDSLKISDFSEENGLSEMKIEERECDRIEGCTEGFVEDSERINLQSFLSLDVLKYIQKLETLLSTAKQELHDWKRDVLQMEHTRKSNNDLLVYLRSLESDMVAELSRPSSPEVEEVIHQLARNILRGFFKEEVSSDYKQDSSSLDTKNYQSSDKESCDTVTTSRDYLAKLLFWCMLLGHHLRSLENRLHLSCAVGLL